MLRDVVNGLGAMRGLGAVGALVVAVPGLASTGASAQPSWVAPALLGLAIVGLAFVALRAVAPAERALVGKGDGTDRGVFVVTRDAVVSRRETPAPTVDRTELRPPRGAVARPAAPGPDAVLRMLSARMDKVTYEPGAPNVLSMTKRLVADVSAAGAAAPVAVTCTRSEEGEETVVAVEGTLDAVTLGEVAPVLEALVESRPRAVVLELSSLHHVDGAGAVAISRLAARCRDHGGAVRAVGLARQPRALFKLLRLDQVLKGS
jgi:anti-anti-sigma factor